MNAARLALVTPEVPLVQAARRIATEVAARHADAVDRDARFPAEAVAALREAGLLGAAVPRALGGQGASIAEIAGACYELGQGCGNAAMVFAMHQIQVACLVQHGQEGWHRDFLERVARRQLLLASATTEGSTGGDVSRSDCAAAAADGLVHLAKEGCVISYAEDCDAIFATARRHEDAPQSDQVLLVAERGQCRLDKRAGWDTLGMRGTGSEGFHLEATVAPGQVLPLPYAVISAQTMLPVSHITWAALWAGIANGAVTRARGYLREKARRAPGVPHGAQRLAGVIASLQAMRGHVADGVRRYQVALGDADRLTAISFVLAMNGLKTTTSAQAVQIIGEAMQVVGLAGYRNDTPFSLGRHLRDAHSAALMVNNDRILGNSAGLLAAYRGEEPLFA
jgi:acyl-CoA dehydrogenase